MNEIAGGGKLLRLRCQGPTSCDWGRPSSFFLNPNSPDTTRRQKAFFPRPLATPKGTAPSPLLLPSTSSPFLFNYGRASPFLCSGSTDVAEPEPPELQPRSVDCVGTGSDVECVVLVPPSDTQKSVNSSSTSWWELAVLVSPFFFWGTAMVAMKPVLPKTGPLFVSAFRLIPAGLLLVAFAASQRRRPPSGLQAWLSISLFALVDASCFQVPPSLLPLPSGWGRFLCFCPGSLQCSMMRIRMVGNDRVSLRRACRGPLRVWAAYVAFLYCVPSLVLSAYISRLLAFTLFRGKSNNSTGSSSVSPSGRRREDGREQNFP